MENIKTVEKNEDDEISLIDLLSVVIRHRKMIVLGTGICAFLAIIWLFIVPIIFPKMNKKTQTITYVLRTERIPGEFNSQTNYDVRTHINMQFTDLTYFADLQKEFNPFFDSSEFKNKKEYNKAVKELFEKGKYKVSAGSAGSISVTCEVPFDRAENLDLFINEYCKRVTALIEEEYFPLFDSAQQNIEKLLNAYSETISTTGTDASIASKIRYDELLEKMRVFRENYEAFVYYDGDIFELDNSQGRVKNLIIITFAAFFVLIFVSFLLNAIENVKKDDEASKKIKDAWNFGK